MGPMALRTRGFWAGLALGVLLATALRAFLPSVFYLSLATLRLNGTAAWTLVLLAPLAAPWVRRSRWPALVAGLAVAALPFARFTPAWVPVAALASAAALLAFARLPRPGLVGALVGLALSGLALLVGRSHDPMLQPWGTPVALGLAALALPRLGHEETDAPRVPEGAAWGALLVVQVAFLASPFALGCRLGVEPWLAGAASFVGLLVGSTLLRRAPWWLLAALAAWGLLDLALVPNGAFGPVPLAALQVALGAAAARLAPPHGAGFGPVATGALFVVLFFGDPMGRRVWTTLVPLLCAAPLALLALRRPSPREPLVRGRLVAPALLGLLLIPLAPAPVPVEPHEGDAFTVVNWNVHQGHGNRGALDPRTYADELRALRPDVVVLQESSTTTLSSGGLDVLRYLAEETGLHVVAAASGGAILSRFPVAADWRGHDAPLGAYAVAVPLDVHGQTVWVQGVHLARNSAERRLQVEDALRLANATPGPRILAGDLNSCPAETCFGGRPSDRMHDLLDVVYQDSWSALHDPDDPAGYTHPAWEPRRRIDVVMVRGLDVLESRPVRDERSLHGSDHLPVLARLRLPAASG